MKKLIVVLLSMAASGVAMAAPPTFIEGALVFGGENARNGSGRQTGIEFTGSWGIDDNWYTGGTFGFYDSRDFAEYTYVNLNGGYAIDVSEKTALNFEGGLWFGEEDLNSGGKNKPKALEAKVGVNHMMADKLLVFGTLSIVGADLDNGSNDDDLSNFIWSLGGAYEFTDVFSVNVKMVNGFNGVNGQDEVLRVGARWAF